MGKAKKSISTAEHELVAQYELFKVIAEQNHEKILEYEVINDTVRIYNVVNRQFVLEEEYENYVQGDIFGNAFVAKEDKNAYRKAFKKCLKKTTHMIMDIRCALGGKNLEWHRLYLVSVAGEDKQVTRIAGRFASIHKEKMDAEKMRLKAEIDALTGIYNHIAFEEECGKAVKDCDSNALFLMLDVDDFKMINDTQGHAVGDMVLGQTGETLKTIVEGRGLAGRLGGDEFAAFVWGFSDEEQMKEFCKELRSRLKMIIFDMEYSASIGVSVLDGREIGFQDMYYEADQAVYASKNAGKNQVTFYSEIENGVIQETKEHKEQYCFEEIEERELLEEYAKCMKFLTKESYRAGVDKMQKELISFFDADCVATISWENETYLGIEEVHKDSASVMAKILSAAVKKGKPVSLSELLDDHGNIWIQNVKEIKDSFPEIYERLAQNRIWSVIGQELCMDYVSYGVLLAVNPRKHLSERHLLHMLAEYMVARTVTQRIMEVREYETTHDHLTGLWNRNSFILWVNSLENDVVGSVGIVTTDIIGLSDVNRDLGYLAGSRKLVRIAKVLQSVFEGYRIFRYDEDEMLVLCPNVAKNDFEFMVGCLKEKLEELDVSVAFGFSWSNHVNVTNQITEAEVIMENDKLCLMHGNKLAQRAEQSVIDEVERLMREGCYLIYLQPKVNVHTGKTVGAEALVRQMDRDLGLVSPGVFIPVLERYNLIHLVDLYVLEQVFRFQKAAIDAGRRVVPISTNFSKKTILQPDLIERVRDLTEKYEIPAGLIHIEVTETIGDMDHVVIDHVADSLKTLGFALSLDDFGTHYSNLAVLIQYDFDSAKIDRSMIMDITTNEKSRIVVDYMTSLINRLGIDCIAEGVETEEQADIMKKTKCEVIQGYFYGKPVPQEEFYDTFMRDEE